MPQDDGLRVDFSLERKDRVMLSVQNEVDAALNRGLAWCAAQQNKDGSFGVTNHLFYTICIAALCKENGLQPEAHVRAETWLKKRTVEELRPVVRGIMKADVLVDVDKKPVDWRNSLAQKRVRSQVVDGAKGFWRGTVVPSATDEKQPVPDDVAWQSHALFRAELFKALETPILDAWYVALINDKSAPDGTPRPNLDVDVEEVLWQKKWKVFLEEIQSRPTTQETTDLRMTVFVMMQLMDL